MERRRPFRFGVVVRGGNTAQEWTDLARRAESLGYSILLMPDHFGDQMAPLPALAAVAGATTSLRLGTLVIGNDFRHPAVLAKEAATLDVISNGRFELGLGTGWSDNDYRWAGIPRDRPGIRIERMAESVQVIRGLFGPDPVSFEGKYYQIGGLTGHPRPVQRDGPPILVGGGGRRMLSVAGHFADIVSVNPNMSGGVFDQSAYDSMTAGATDKKLSWVRAAAGERMDDLEISIMKFAIEVTADVDKGAEVAAARFGMDPAAVLASPHAMIGPPARIIEDLQTQRERWLASHVVVPGPYMERLATVVAALSGR